MRRTPLSKLEGSVVEGRGGSQRRNPAMAVGFPSISPTLGFRRSSKTTALRSTQQIPGVEWVMSLYEKRKAPGAPLAVARFAKAKSSEVVAKEVAKRRISAPPVAPSTAGSAKADAAMPDAPGSAKGECSVCCQL